MFSQIFTPADLTLLLKMFFALIAGILIGAERESRGKPAGISTFSLVIGGSTLFTILSILIDPNEPARIAAQIITGIGFLGAGMIFLNGKDKIKNLTTAASVWFSAAIGMSIGFGMYFIALIATIFALIAPRIPSLQPKHSR